ncbi:hypothetical protein ACQP08_20740 [Micromonospora zamorensis]|uniref:hypothetical protein n=1 Tax=Micromonospora zamorensis TaxID=709883 RepID=UPI003D939401
MSAEADGNSVAVTRPWLDADADADADADVDAVARVAGGCPKPPTDHRAAPGGPLGRIPAAAAGPRHA